MTIDNLNLTLGFSAVVDGNGSFAERIPLQEVLILLLVFLIERKSESLCGKSEALCGKGESLSGKNESPITGKMKRGYSHRSKPKESLWTRKDNFRTSSY